MQKERTLALIKPAAIEHRYAGEIISMIERNGFRILAMKKLILSKRHAEDFYAVHNEKDFFTDLVEFMSSAPVIAMVLQKENAIEDWRKLMGGTDPMYAEDGTIRKLYADSKQKNAVHGSDSPENALKEIRFFFSNIELIDHYYGEIDA